jgi:hypothetical protein
LDGDVTFMGTEDTDANLWLENLDGKSVQIWREALAHLRHLSDEVWKVFKCFMVINGFILVFVTVVAMAGDADNFAGQFVLTVVILLGIGATFTGRYMLKRNRIYYLEMLLKKTLVEHEFGFYDAKFSGTNTDLAFPWRLKPEAIDELKRSPEEWVARQVRGRGTIARWLFVMFETVIGIYFALFALIGYVWLHYL